MRSHPAGTILEDLLKLANIIESSITGTPTQRPTSTSYLMQAQKDEGLKAITVEIRNIVQQIQDNDDPQLIKKYDKVAKTLYNALKDPSDKNILAIRIASHSTALEANAYKIARYIALTKKALITAISKYFIAITFAALATAAFGPGAGFIVGMTMRELSGPLGLDEIREPYKKKADTAKKASTQFYQIHKSLEKLAKEIPANEPIITDAIKSTAKR